jgi:energy-coupling factor transporter transmembrane protein EcfT
MINAAAFAAPPPRPTFLTALHPATRLGWLALLVAVAMAAPWPAVAVLAVGLAVALAGTGLRAGAQLGLLRPWLPMAALALLVHTLTTTAAAPLGHPSWAGAGAGLRALLRLGATLAVLAVYLRSGSLDDLVAGLGWWLRPLGRVGLSVDDLSLSVAVACGTVPQVIGEGRRLQTVTRLRRHLHDGTKRRAAAFGLRPWNGWLDRARLVVPLLETLGRRAETLELALRGRRPAAVAGGGPRAGEWAWLGTGLLTAAALMLLRGGR